MTSTITTSTSSSATAFGNQRRQDRCQNGVLWELNWDGSSVNIDPWCSTDNGATWAAKPSIPFSGSSNSYLPNCSLFIDLDDYAHVVFKDRSNGYLYYTRGTPNTARTSYSWSTPTNGIYPGAGEDLPDVVAHRDPANAGAWVVHVVACANSGTSQVVDYTRFTISSTGTINLATSTRLGGTYGTTVPCYPSLDFRHTGDGKTVAGSSPDVFVGWSVNGTGTRFMKLTYSSGSWTPGTERAIDTHFSSGQAFAPMFFDGSRCVFAGLQVSSSTTDIVCHDRDAADTTTTTRTLVASPTAAQTLLCGSTSYDASGNVYFFGAENASAGSANLNWYKWTRSSSTLSAKTTLIATSNGVPYVSARRSGSGSRIDCVYTQNTASPYAVNFAAIILNTAPNASAPTLAGGASTFDCTSALPVTITFSDPDTGDSLSKWDLRYRVQGTSTWTTPAGQTGVAASGTSATTSIPANTFTSGQVAEVEEQTYDAQGAASGWSASAFSTGATPPATPIFTAPAAGATVTSSSVPVTFSESSLDSYTWSVVNDVSGSAGSTTVNAGATVTDSTSRAFTITGLANNQTVHVRLTATKSGLTSSTADLKLVVSYTPPAACTFTITPVVTQPAPWNLPDAFDIAITDPAPSGSQPTVTGHDVWVDDGTTEGLRRVVAGVGGTWRHQTPVSARDYSGGRIVVYALGANGTSTPTSS